MAEIEKRAEAKQLYVQGRVAVRDIAHALKLSEASIYRWKNEDSDFGLDYDWDELRRNAMPVNIVAIQRQYWDALSKHLRKLQEDEKMLLDPKIADAIAKHISAVNKLVPKKTWYSACVAVLDEIKSYLATNDPDLWDRFVSHVPAIQNALERQVIDA